MRRVLLTALAAFMLFASSLRAQNPQPSPNPSLDKGEANSRQARLALDAMVKALGGAAWLAVQTVSSEGRAAAFFQGQPTGSTTDFAEVESWPDQTRIDLGKRRDVVQFFVGRQGWEITYKGQATLPREQIDEFLRRRDHSLQTVVRNWLNRPGTVMMYEGARLTERHLAERVTLITAENDSVTIDLDAESHLPLRRSFQWRDPAFKDLNLEAEAYDNFHPIDGIQTPLIITRFKNDEITSQRFLFRVRYNLALAGDFWSLESAGRRIRK